LEKVRCFREHQIRIVKVFKRTPAWNRYSALENTSLEKVGAVENQLVTGRMPKDHQLGTGGIS
jgi:hypothetical protein